MSLPENPGVGGFTLRPFFAILLALLATSCLAASPPPVALARIPIAMHHCGYVETNVRVPAVILRAYVPADFEIAGDVGTVLLGGAACADATSGNLSGPASFGWTSVEVQAPQAAWLRSSDPLVSVYLYRLEHFVITGDVYRSVADQVGAERIQLDAIDPQIMAGAALHLSGPNGFEHVVAGPVAQTLVPAVTSVHWREFGTIPGGNAVLEATLKPDTRSWGMPSETHTSPGSVANAVMGPEAPGQMSYGRAYDIRDGYMQSLARP